MPGTKTCSGDGGARTWNRGDRGDDEVDEGCCSSICRAPPMDSDSVRPNADILAVGNEGNSYGSCMGGLVRDEGDRKTGGTAIAMLP